jgi:hypothetical protein
VEPRFFIVILLSFFLLRSALASDVAIDPSIATLGAIAPGAIINDDLKPHTWKFHPTAGYFTGSTTVDGSGSTASSHGFGGTVEAQYAWNEHFGVNFSALGFSGSGNYASGSSGATGSSSVNGWLAGAALVFDPFSGSSFRMPFFFGVNYEHLASSTPASPIVTSLSLTSAGYSFGVSPRFNIGFFRVEPFIVATTPTSKGNVTCAADVVAGACGAQEVEVLPVLGVNLIFRPLNLSFYFNVSSLLLGTGVAFYSVGPQLAF